MAEKITLNFYFFAALKDAIGPQASISFTNEITLNDIKKFFENNYPDLEQWFAHCQYAVNEEIVYEDYKFRNQDTIYVLPAASGG